MNLFTSQVSVRGQERYPYSNSKHGQKGSGSVVFIKVNDTYQMALEIFKKDYSQLLQTDMIVPVSDEIAHYWMGF